MSYKQVKYFQDLPKKKRTDVSVKKGGIIACIAWIPLLIVALLISLLLGVDLLRLFFPDFYWPHWQHVDFVNTMGYIGLIGAFMVAVVGETILIRHGYGSMKFWKHAAIWYAVYVVLTVGMTLWEGIYFNVLCDPPFIPLTIAFCLYSVFALLELMLVMAITKYIKKEVGRWARIKSPPFF